MNSEHKWRFWYHKIIYFSKLAICLTFEYMLFPLGNGVRGKIRPIFAQCAPPQKKLASYEAKLAYSRRTKIQKFAQCRVPPPQDATRAAPPPCLELPKYI